MKNMRFPLINVFNPAYDLHAGLTIDNDSYCYILVARNSGRSPRVLLRQKGPVAAMKIPFQCPVHGDLGKEPVWLIFEKLAAQSPEEWVDQNEERIIPRGFASHEIVNEWCVHDATLLYSGTITKKSLEKVLSRLRPDKLFIASVSVPLWDLARLYAQHIAGPFIIWKVLPNESILGFVEQGRLCRLCNYWAGANDIAKNGIEIGTGLLQLKQSLTRVEQRIKIVVCSSIADFAIFRNAIEAPELDFVAAPVINNLPPEFHEVYALALHEETHLDFALGGQALEARSLAYSRDRALRVIRIALVAMLFAAAALFVGKGVTLLGEHYVNAKMDPVSKHLKRYKTEQSRLESLAREMEQKTRFIAQRSALTYPMTELQTAFPEGAWAEEIVFSEGAAESWNFSLIALSTANNLIPELLKNISSIRGMEEARMIYSEQIAMKDKTGQRAIKIKIEGRWRNVE